MRRRTSKSLEKALSKGRKEEIRNSIKNHTSSENDGADKTFQRYINFVDNLEIIKLGTIKNKNDEWYQDYVKAYKSLKAQYDYFLKQRKKLQK